MPSVVRVLPIPLCLYLFLVCGEIKAQEYLRYRQVIASSANSYHADELVSCDTVGGVMTFASRTTLLRMSIPERTAAKIVTPGELLANDYMSGTPYEGRFFGMVWSLSFKAFSWSADSGVVLRPIPNAASRAITSVNGPFVQLFSGFQSFDGGHTWSTRKQQYKDASSTVIPGALAVTVTNTGNDRWRLLFRSTPDTLYPAWTTSMRIRAARRYGEDSLLCMSAARLFRSRLGDTTFVPVDSMLVEGTYRALRPRYLESLDGGAVLYCDEAGWYGVIDRMSIRESVALDLGRSPVYPWHTSDVAYWLESVRDSLRIYKIGLRTTPIVNTLSIPGEFGIADTRSEFQPSCFGTYGLTLQIGATREYIVDLHDTTPSILMLGSLLAPVVDHLPLRRIIFSWVDQNDRTHALDDIGNAIRVDTNMAGVLTHPLVVFNQGDQMITSPTSVPPQGRTWREAGTPLPTKWNSTLVFPGPVIRRFSLDGRLLDTLARVPVCFASTIDDSILATGSKGVVRLQTTTRFDSTLLSSASNIVADTVGYPSSMARARDGALVLTVLGTSFLHRDSAEATQRRWGGILRSTNEGTTWTTVSIPSTGSYVMHCMRTSSGTLIASSMLMVEDSTHTVDLNAPESYYTASNIEVMRSTDDGRTWSITGTAFYSGPFQPCTGNIIETTPGVLYAATLGGVMLSTDDGRTWSTDEQLPPTAQPSSVSLSATGILVATTQGVYEIPTVTSVREDPRTSECRPMALTRTSMRLLMQQADISSLLLCDVNGRTISITLTSDLAALATGLYTVLDCDIAAVPSSVLILE